MENNTSKEDKEAIKTQHEKGKLTARERLEVLLDKGSFTELNADMELTSTNFNLQEKKIPGDGVITGYGRINGKPVCVFAQDFIFMGGSMGERHTRKIAAILGEALKNGAPVIGLLDSGGARIQEGISGLDGGGEIFFKNTAASGVIPQIAAIMGPCAGIAAYSPALCDFIFMVDSTSTMFITGPEVIKAVTGEQIDADGLGGPVAHTSKSGVADASFRSEKDCLMAIRKLLAYLPQNNLDAPPQGHTSDSPTRQTKRLDAIVPLDPKKAYDVRDVIAEVFDRGSFLEMKKEFATNIVTGFARLNDIPVGIVGNQPKVLAGCIDINASDKIARFVRFCDAFNIALINLVDVTGFLPGVEQEHNGIIRHGAKVLYAYSEATVPKISLVMRKAYGGAYIAMVSKDMGYDKVLAWPTAEIAVMGAEQAAKIVNRKEIAASKKPEEALAKKAASYEEALLNPYVAAKKGKVDIILDPSETRRILIRALAMCISKREKRPAKKHGSIPL